MEDKIRNILGPHGMTKLNRNKMFVVGSATTLPGATAVDKETTQEQVRPVAIQTHCSKVSSQL